jgi:hypothetical protein
MQKSLTLKIVTVRFSENIENPVYSTQLVPENRSTTFSFYYVNDELAMMWWWSRST